MEIRVCGSHDLLSHVCLGLHEVLEVRREEGPDVWERREEDEVGSYPQICLCGYSLLYPEFEVLVILMCLVNPRILASEAKLHVAKY